MARVKTKSTQEGKISKTIRVTTDDPGGRPLVLRLEAKVVAPVSVYPRRRVYLGVVEGEKAEVRLVLRRRDGEPLEVKDVQVRDPDLVSVSWERVQEPGQVAGQKVDRGDVVLVVTPAERIRGVSRSTVLKVGTDVPDEPVVEIPVSVRVRPRIQISPPQAHLVLPTQGGEGTVRMVRLASTTGKPFRILDVQNERPDDVEVEWDRERVGVQHTLTLRVTDAAAQKKLGLAVRGKLLIRTDDPIARELKVPFVVERRLMPKRSKGTVRPVQRSTAAPAPGGLHLKGAPGSPEPVGTPVKVQPTPTPAPGGNG